MRRSIAAVAFLAFAVPIARADEKDDAAKKLNGTYEVVSVLRAGKPVDPMKDTAPVFSIKDGVLSIKEGKHEETAKFTLDPSKKPAHIDLSPEKGDKKTVLGIYEAKETDKGLELNIAFSKATNAERPKDFDGKGDSDTVIKLFRKK